MERERRGEGRKCKVPPPTFVACLPVTPQDSSLHHFLSQSVTMYSARAVTFIISDTLIVYVTYLLTFE